MRLDNSCPFCGEHKHVASAHISSLVGKTEQFVVVCHNCGARGPVADALNDAIDAWLVRTPKPIWKRLEEECKVTP